MTFKEIMAAFEDAGLEPRSYSGRFMYGKSCLGVETDGEPADIILDVVAEILGRDGGGQFLVEMCEALRGVRTDNLGTGTIMYWPDIPWEGEQDDN